MGRCMLLIFFCLFLKHTTNFMVLQTAPANNGKNAAILVPNRTGCTGLGVYAINKENYILNATTEEGCNTKKNKNVNGLIDYAAQVQVRSILVTFQLVMHLIFARTAKM